MVASDVRGTKIDIHIYIERERLGVHLKEAKIEEEEEKKTREDR